MMNGRGISFALNWMMAKLSTCAGVISGLLEVTAMLVIVSTETE